MKKIVPILFVLFFSSDVYAQVRLTADLTLGRFEQQVKSEIGGERGDRLVEDTFLGLHLAGAYHIGDYVSLGLFLRGDVGSREAATFDRFDENNVPIVTGTTGGPFSEFWVGPFISGHYKMFYGELGYGAFGIRSDDGREDLPGVGDDVDSAFRTSPVVAWMIALGATLPIVDTLHATLRLEYRVRYYTKRGGENLANDVAHGTQSLTPLFGVVWTL